MGHLTVTIGHLRVTVGHLRVTVSHPWVTMGYLSVQNSATFLMLLLKSSKKVQGVP